MPLFVCANDCKLSFNLSHFLECWCLYVWKIVSQICFRFLLLACNCSHIQMIASHLNKFKTILVCHHPYVRTIASHLKKMQNNSGVPPFVCVNDCKSYLLWILISGVQSFICANGCKSSFLILSSGVPTFIRVKSSHIFIFISGVQLFTYMNDCRSCFDFYFIFWHAIVRMCEQLQVVICFGFYFLVCPCSYV